MSETASVNVEELAHVHARHVAQWGTQYDGKGGVAWEDNGGLRCSCGWSAKPVTYYRPWPEWHAHVVSAILAAMDM